jgi:carbamoyltransferase
MRMIKKEIYSLGILNAVSHDPSACVTKCTVVNNEIIDIEYVHFEEGMLSRTKKSGLFPTLSIYKCLDYFKIDIDRLDILQTDYAELDDWHNSLPKNRKSVADYLKKILNIDPQKISITEGHHLAHAYTAVWPSGFKDSNILIVDGAGTNYETSTYYNFDRTNGIKKSHALAGTGIGVLYTLVTKLLGFKTGEEGKTMGLAPFFKLNSKNKYNFKGIDGEYFTDYTNILNRFPSHSFKESIRMRKPTENIFQSNWIALAYAVQSELERTLKRTLLKIRKDKKSANLCYAGGVALNCVANNKIIEAGYFEKVFIQPNSGDAGVSLGLSLIGIHTILRKRKIDEEKFWEIGSKSFKKYSDIDPAGKKIFIDACKELGINLKRVNYRNIAQELNKNKVIAHFEKGWEFGPRALGHRSFLASAKNTNMKNILNKKIKHRELYRPFAPIVIKEDFHKYFKSKVNDHPYMLCAVKCLEYAEKTIPAAVHIDGSARAQTVTSIDGQIYKILEEYKNLTKTSVLINTSFNDNNEPIVYSEIDALSCFLRTNADLLIIDDLMIDSKELKDRKEIILNKINNISNINLEKTYKLAKNKIFKNNSVVETPSAFFNRKLIVSLYERYCQPLERLETKLSSSHNNSTILITDKYHEPLLKYFTSLNKRNFKKIILVNDDSKSFNKLRFNKNNKYFVVLYNNSLFNEKNPMNVEMFYKKFDTKINFSLERIKEIPEIIQNSYEFKRNKNIDDFLTSFIFPEFNKNYFKSANMVDVNRELYTINS